MLRTRFQESLKEALLARDERSVSTLRLILAALKDRDIAARETGNTTGIEDAQIASMLHAMIKQRRESAHLYQQGNRPDLAKQEEEEIKIIEKFLPPQLSDAQIDEAVAAAVAEIEAKSLRDMGRVMALLKERYTGQMDMAKAGAIVKARLI